MGVKSSILKTYKSFSDSGLQNADKLKYNNINLVIGENGVGKTRFLKSLQNEISNTNHIEKVITLYFPELYESISNENNIEESDYIFDIFKGNIDLDFKDFLKVIENAPDKEGFFDDFKNWLNTKAKKEKNKAEVSFNEINNIMKELINRHVEIDENEKIYICKIGRAHV